MFLSRLKLIFNKHQTCNVLCLVLLSWHKTISMAKSPNNPTQRCCHSFNNHSILFSLDARCYQVSTEGDINIHVVTVNGVLPLPLVESNPYLIIQRQIQHDTLALHDGPLTGLSVQDHLLLVVVHQVEVGLLKVPGVDVNVEEVDPWHIAVELALEHVEVLMEVNKHRVEHQRLVVVHAVQGLATSHREGRVRDLAGVTRGTCLAFAAFRACGSFEARISLWARFARCSFVAFVSFIT